MTKGQAKRIGRLLATARRNQGWSVRRLGNETGISHTWLFKLENGEYLTPSPGRLVMVTDALGVDPERIDRLAKGQIAETMPGLRTYFRAKYDLTQEEIDQIEQTVQEVQRNHEQGGNK